MVVFGLMNEPHETIFIFVPWTVFKNQHTLNEYIPTVSEEL
jgi:hypothetical protein